MNSKIQFILNGNKIRTTIKNNWTLLYLIRENIKLTGTKEGCGVGECGACTVLVNNKAINSCIYLAIRANGKKITTIEGLKKKKKGINQIQKSFIKNGGIQCGFCSPGMILSTKALLNENSKPNRKEIKNAISGNICRCTGYEQIIKSIKKTIKNKYIKKKENF